MNDAQQTPDRAAASQCLEEIIAVCRKYRLVLAHEDTNGAFQLIRDGESVRDDYEQWLRAASLR